MILKNLKLNHFRNYYRETFVAGDKINLVYGENGHGKTNLLEAIYYLALCQSFRATNDKECLNHLSETDFFSLDAEFENRFSSTEKVKLTYATNETKRISVNEIEEDRLKNHIGRIPVVLLKPDDLKLSFGGPAERRRFLDVTLSQLSPLYVDSLLRYKKIVRQKNSLLKSSVVNSDLINTWNSNLIKYGSEIIKKRHELINELNEYVPKYYEKISGQSVKTELQYQSNVKFDSAESIATNFREELEKSSRSELIQKISLVGPHRDDIQFSINNKQAGSYASQGENKTFVVSLKLAEMDVLLSHKDEKPLLIFDDVFNELDKTRVENLMNFLTDIGQVFISTTNENLISGEFVKKTYILNGKIKELSSMKWN